MISESGSGNTSSIESIAGKMSPTWRRDHVAPDLLIMHGFVFLLHEEN